MCVKTPLLPTPDRLIHTLMIHTQSKKSNTQDLNIHTPEGGGAHLDQAGHRRLALPPAGRFLGASLTC